MLLALCCFLTGFCAKFLLTSVLSRVKRTSASSRRPGSEVYDDGGDTLLLNLVEPTTRWFNMGFWAPGERSFPAAAAELCRRVAHAARLEPHTRVCEVGYGSGDSTLLLSREFAPSRYLGLTSLPHQHATAVIRAAKAGLATDRFQLRRGDAARDLNSEPPASYDAVLAVDCAYHFATRVAFFSSASRLLRPGGHLALTDLLLPSSDLSRFDRLLLRLLFYLAGAPFANFVTPATYIAQLRAAGFDESTVTLEDISSSVWPGFCAFVRDRNDAFGPPGAAILGEKWTGLVRYARVVEWYSGVGSGKPKLAFYLISAQKKAHQVQEEKELHARVS